MEPSQPTRLLSVSPKWQLFHHREKWPAVQTVYDLHEDEQEKETVPSLPSLREACCSFRVGNFLLLSSLFQQCHHCPPPPYLHGGFRAAFLQPCFRGEGTFLNQLQCLKNSPGCSHCWASCSSHASPYPHHLCSFKKATI